MDYFDIQAQNKELWFFNRLKKGVSCKGRYEFLTGKGRSNSVIKVTSDAIYLRSKKGWKMNRISRDKLKKDSVYVLSANQHP